MSLFILSDFMIHAVKAIIYRDDGHLLMQQRDYAPGLIFPGCWTFFGGQVEAGENLKDALRRELLEELGCVPGPVGDELFQWACQVVSPSQNHFFPVLCEVNDDALELNEGQAMSWFPIDGLQDIHLIPGVYENLPKIATFLGLHTQVMQQLRE
jgi:8-oxo-dGTP diphosphatase